MTTAETNRAPDCGTNASVWPRVSVVTVVRNAKDKLEKTLDSVLAQEYPNYEVIVIDGASTDGTAEAIERRGDRLAFWVSEPDDGIYPAMNKGAAAARGEWIVFMNAGDRFSGPQALRSLSRELHSDADVILAGATTVVTDRYETRNFAVSPGTLHDLWRRIPTVHQAVLIRRSLQLAYGFDTSYAWCADHDLLARLHRDGHRFAINETPFCVFDGSGGRQRDPTLYIRERWRLSRGLAPVSRRIFQFGGEWLHCRVWGPIVMFLRTLMPRPMVLKLRRLRKTAGTKE